MLYPYSKQKMTPHIPLHLLLAQTAMFVLAAAPYAQSGSEVMAQQINVLN